MKSVACLIVLLLSFSLAAQKTAVAKPTGAPKQPRLVVGIVVDQMRYDYLWRYWSKFGEGGFKKLINQGFLCKNTHFNYVPTYTAPGHASIYTGTTPATHGIISNNWYDKQTNKILYCVEDTLVKPVGTSADKGKMSPKRLLTTTVTDQLRLSNLNKSKTFGIALKERSAILPAGHNTNGAFWFDGSVGGFVTSAFYMDKLPDWVQKYNDTKPAINYLMKGWTPLLPIEKYTESLEDNSKYEYAPTQPDMPYFPYNYSKILEKKKYEAIAYTPYGNSITKDLAIECLKNEKLGKDEFADMLCVSFSSTDIIAHAYGIRAIEVEDVYLRLDKDIEELLKVIEKEAGAGNFVVFLTADHGAADNAEYLADNKIPAGLLSDAGMQKEIRGFLSGVYGDSLALSYSNQQVFLNESLLAVKKISKDEVLQKLSDWLMSRPGIAEVYSYKEMRNQSYGPGSMKYLLQRGYNHQLSGDLLVNYSVGWMEYEKKGTTHGAPYSYDTHVPLIFYGAGIKKGETVKRVEITDIAPTISQLLNIEYPNGCIGNPIMEVLEK
jgi:predicted AlkP superfamily pyrophosphatase or phosphodiesterase